MIGRVLKGQYRIDGELGRGAMGEVYRGLHEGLGKVVAIKLLRRDGFPTADALERFSREARTASLLSHPGIAQVFDYGVEDGLPFLVMEYVEGKEVSEVLREEGPLSPPRAIALMRQLCAALEEAHRHGVVHRDIKPQNMKLLRYVPGGKLVLKLLDLGCAKQVGQQQDILTKPGMIIGTPAYMAPEQITGTVDARADLYAAGVTFYELLTARVPFFGFSVEAILTGHLTRPPPPLPDRVPEPVRQVVMRLLEKKPEARYPDTAALDLALSACEEACLRPASPSPPAVGGALRRFLARLRRPG